MIRGRCPICGKTFETASLNDWPSFPFCTERCKMVDLGRWIDGAYAIPEKPEPQGEVDRELSSDDDEED